MKRKLLCVTMVLVFLCACAVPAAQPAEGESQSPSEAAVEIRAGSEEATAEHEVAMATGSLSAKETIEAFFQLQYQGYRNLQYQDVSHLLDMEETRNINTVVWLKTQTMRRRLCQENNFCYVDTNQYSYKIKYISASELKDNRVSEWKGYLQKNPGLTLYHFEVTGEEGKVYPPGLGVNTQHTMMMKQEGSQWKIYYHYYSGSLRRFNAYEEQSVPSEASMLAGLEREFASASVESLSVPEGAYLYNADQAVQYAKTYTEKRNTSFYDVGDWSGNCANFTSQVIWYGFNQEGNTKPSGRSYMNAAWYAGEGGGSPAWENVNYCWSHMVATGGLAGAQLTGVRAMEPGDMLQTRAASDHGVEGRFNHSLILVDKEKMIFAQNSPNALTYYSDLQFSDSRFIRPVYLVA